MDRTRAGYALAGLLALVVVGLAAATLTNTRSPTSATEGGSGTGTGGGSAVIPVPQAPDLVGGGILLLLIGVLAWLLVVGFAYGIVKYPVQSGTELLRTVFAVGVVLAVFWVLFQVMKGPTRSTLIDLDRPNNTGGGGVGNGNAEGGGAGGVQEAVDVVATDVPVLAVVLVTLLAVGLVGLVLARRPTREDDDADTDGEDGSLAAIGRIAGAAADRLEASATVDNEVYRAWKEMTDHLDLAKPETRTPGEFREAALAAGMAREDVDRLTRLFEEVRYGGAAPTAEREERAVDALRRIERRYAEGES